MGVSSGEERGEEAGKATVVVMGALVREEEEAGVLYRLRRPGKRAAGYVKEEEREL